MPASPTATSEGVVRLVVSSEGTAVSESVRIISADIHRAVNAIPTARLVMADGDIALREFALSDSASFKPGAAIKVAAGYGDNEETLFEGVVVKHGIRITGNNEARLVIECRDKAVAMTVGRKNANYVDKKDSDIISTLVGAAGLTADVEATTLQFSELVQYYCTDWDFMLARAEAAGLLVIVTDGTVAVKAPQTSTEPALKVGYGVDLIEFHGEIDARTQLAAAQATGWDPKTQAVAQGDEAAPATLNAHGDLTSATLAEVVGLASYRLQTAVPLPKPALTQWAKSQQVKAGLARVRGRMKFQGSALAKVGELIEVDGVGAHFSGKVFVGALDHSITEGDWVTTAEFGLAPNWFAERSDVMAPAAGGLLPGAGGLQVGVVKKLDADPLGEHRIQVSVPVLQATTEGVWARLANFHGSNAFGAFFMPEVGDEVVLGYFADDPSHPVILGSLYSSKQVPPYDLVADNHIKAIVTKCKSKIEFNETDKVITITTPGKNKLVFSDTDKSILIQDQNSNKIELGTGGITLDSPKDIKITAKGGITIDAVNAVSISSKADVKAAGLNINCEAQVGFVGKGTANAELSAAGQTVVKGAMVMIN
jgi:Rhs element Vgr protein